MSPFPLCVLCVLKVLTGVNLDGPGRCVWYIYIYTSGRMIIYNGSIFCIISSTRTPLSPTSAVSDVTQLQETYPLPAVIDKRAAPPHTQIARHPPPYHLPGPSRFTFVKTFKTQRTQEATDYIIYI